MHPFNSHRSEEHKRAHGVLSRSGNKVPREGYHADARADGKMIEKGVHEHESAMHPGKTKTKLKFAHGGSIEGEAAPHSMARRARGGHAGGGKGKGHVTNVIVAPQGGGGGPPGGMRPPMPAMPPRAAAAPPGAAPGGPPPGGPPMGGPPPGGGMGGPPMGAKPPGMMKSGGGVQKTSQEGVPHEALMQAKKGGHVREREGRHKEHHRERRDVGGPTGMPPAAPQTASAGVPANPTQMTPQQLQQIAQIRRAKMQQAQAQQAAAQGGAGAARPMPGAGQPPMRGGGEVHVKEHTRRARGGDVDMEAGAGSGIGRIEKMHEYGEGGFKPKKVPLHAE